MRLALAILVLVTTSASAGELCLVDGLGYYCDGFPPCEFIPGVRTIGYNTESDPCVYEPDFSDFPMAALSSSLHDPDRHSGPIPAHGRLYLWTGENQSCTWQFSLVAAGDLPIIGYEPIAAGNHDWDPSTQTLAYDGCVGEFPRVIGAFVMFPGVLPVDPQAWGRIKSLYR